MASKKRSSSKKQPKSSKKAERSAVAKPKPSSSVGAIPAVPDGEATPVVAPRSLEATVPVATPPTSPKDDRRASTADRRLWRRIPFFRTIQYKFDTIDQFKSEIAGDLSLGGIFIKTEKPEPVGSVIYLEFDLRDGSKILAGYGKVVRVNPVGQPDYDPGMGVEFLKFDEESTTRIRQLVSERYR